MKAHYHTFILLILSSFLTTASHAKRYVETSPFSETLVQPFNSIFNEIQSEPIVNIQPNFFRPLAHAFIDHSQQILACKQKSKPFVLNKADNQYLKKYPKYFFIGAFLLSIKNQDRCSQKTLQKLRKEFDKLHITFDVLGIKDKRLLALTQRPYFFESISVREFKQNWDKIPLNLRQYLKKRIGTRLYKTDPLFQHII